MNFKNPDEICKSYFENKLRFTILWIRERGSKSFEPSLGLKYLLTCWSTSSIFYKGISYSKILLNPSFSHLWSRLKTWNGTRSSEEYLTKETPILVRIFFNQAAFIKLEGTEAKTSIKRGKRTKPRPQAQGQASGWGRISDECLEVPRLNKFPSLLVTWNCLVFSIWSK